MSYYLIIVRGPELLSKWLGDSEKAIQTLFRRARAVAPSIVFFDEIDALATRRGVGGSSGVNERVLSQLLTELDGGGRDNSSASLFTSRVIVVAATNRPDILDDALMRPGRIDRKIYVPPPDADSRRQIFDGQFKKFPCAEVFDLTSLVEITSGFSGAEVVAVCSEAALAAIEEKKESVEFSHVLKAIKATKPQITSAVLSFYEEFYKANCIS
jgi:AAA family ATPase